MPKALRSLLLFAASLGSIAPAAMAQDPSREATAESPEVAAVRQLFERYKTALLDGDGEVASALVDAATLEYFEEIKRLTVEGDASAIGERPFVDRLLIVTMRHELPPETLADMGLEDLLRHAVEAGWIGKQSIRQLGIGDIEVAGDEATGVAVTTGLQTADAEPLYYRFVREDEEWRFRFSSLVESINGVVAQLTAQLGTDEDDLIFLLVEQLSGRQVLPEIWQRPD